MEVESDSFWTISVQIVRCASRSTNEVVRKHKTNLFSFLPSAASLFQTLNRRHCVFHVALTPAPRCHRSSDETGGDIFIQVVASASLISIFLPPTLKLQPIVGVICSYAEPTIWQSRRSKPKQGCTDSWRRSCKIKQKNKLLSSPHPPKSCLLRLRAPCPI